jgi:uncharacterized protein YdaU (DUF1376 family)
MARLTNARWNACVKYWPRYVGDFKKKTSALSLLEKGAYTEMLDFCYANEQPLPSELNRIWAIAGAITETEKKAVEKVLTMFFVKNGTGWTNRRTIEELDKWHSKSKKATDSANEKWRIEREKKK